MSSSRRPGWSRFPTRSARVVLVAVVVLFAGCEWLLSLDTIPPECWITSPADSAMVSGNVNVRAEAFDSVGVERIEFYADGVRFATDSSSQASTTWDVSGLPEESWHQLFCIAYDLAGNAGYSDTVSVRVASASQRSVYHGSLSVSAGAYVGVKFETLVGDSLKGEARAASGGTIGRFIWLDNANYQQFKQGGSYTSLYEVTGVSELSLAQPVPAAGTYYLVFANTQSSRQTYWVRFVLE
ncbi:MAG: Ig-like domain-containing protein [candidate division WOR-3 bacterium]